VIKTDKTQRVSKDITAKLKELRLLNRVKFMKKELILCPMIDQERSPMYCMLCEYFSRRIKGIIYCKYPE